MTDSVYRTSMRTHMASAISSLTIMVPGRCPFLCILEHPRLVRLMFNPSYPIFLRREARNHFVTR